jgi:hypothetical protein
VSIRSRWILAEARFFEFLSRASLLSLQSALGETLIMFVQLPFGVAELAFANGRECTIDDSSFIGEATQFR